MWQRLALLGLLVATPVAGVVGGFAIAKLMQEPDDPLRGGEAGVPPLGRSIVASPLGPPVAEIPLTPPATEPSAADKPAAPAARGTYHGPRTASARVVPSAPPLSVQEVSAKAVISLQSLPAPGSAGALIAPPAPSATTSVRGGVLDLQPFRTVESLTDAAGTPYRLVHPNPHVNAWFLLQRGGSEPASLHLDNPFPTDQRIELTADGLVISQGSKRTPCRWQGQGLFDPARGALTPVCDGRLWLRATRAGFRTRQDAVVEALRGMGDLGEGLINLYKTELHQDATLEAASWHVASRGAALNSPRAEAVPLPLPALMQPNSDAVPIQRDRLGIDVVGSAGALALGRWYPASHHPGVAVSMTIPGRIAKEVFDTYKDRVAALEPTEATALVYLMAFDLDRYELEYRLGTDHPAVGWSRRAAVEQSGAGPDGFGAVAPFVRVGMINPYDLPRLTATITGGFKREHSAFKAGPLARVNAGSHYGFMEDGVILSRLQPGLSSVISRLDGVTELKTWDEGDDRRLSSFRSVRQNGVPLIEAVAGGGPGMPGATVNNWAEGNWSGALVVATNDDGTRRNSGALRSLRSGLCVQTASNGKRWLMYGWFTAATPSAMARTFQAYRCSYALHLDMNSADLTYAALYRGSGGQLMPEYLNTTMAGSEAGAGQLRYVTSNDGRDFFAVMKKAQR